MNTSEMERKSRSADLPWYYRLLLKLPSPSLEHFGARFQGLFYAVVLPILIVCTFWLTFLEIVFLPTPINILAVVASVSLVFGFFLRIQLERSVNAWDAMERKEPLSWDIEKNIERYFELLDKSEEKE